MPADFAAAVPRDRGATLALGFGTAIAMWAAGYVSHLPSVVVPGVLVAAGLLALMFAGGVAAGRYQDQGWRGGLRTGLLASLLNMLVLGSLLASPAGANRIVPSALLWAPGALLAGAALGALGGLVGGRAPARVVVDWTCVFAWVGAGATLLLVAVGGVVTSQGAGLAVTDWPNSFGYNMFLYPLSRMTGGIYYEHAHRLFGSLVGLTTLALAIHLFRVEARRSVKWLGAGALALVVGQGILGGLRVTGRFTLSASPADTAPSTLLAAVHGVTAQVFFALMVALAVVTSSAWRAAGRSAAPSAQADRGLSAALIGCLAVQLGLGAALRHKGVGLLVHVSMAAIVLVVAVVVGVRAWGPANRPPLLRRIGIALIVAVGLQVLLGFGALIAVAGAPGAASAGPLRALLATPHQVMGAVLFGVATAVALWNRRLL